LHAAGAIIRDYPIRAAVDLSPLVAARPARLSLRRAFLSRFYSLGSRRDVCIRLWLAIIPSDRKTLLCNSMQICQPLLFSVSRFVRLLLSGHQTVTFENAALRLQLAAFQRKRRRPVLTSFDRLFWVTLGRLWSGWRGPLQYVQPDTVVRWQRERFRRFWARLSKPHRGGRGRPATASEIPRLIERMLSANPLWRDPRNSRRTQDARNSDFGAHGVADQIPKLVIHLRPTTATP
jgi:hypothetical protein